MRGRFKKGKDKRRRCGFTKEECRRGFHAAMEKAMHCRDWGLLAWVTRKIRGYYRRERRKNGESANAGREARRAS